MCTSTGDELTVAGKATGATCICMRHAGQPENMCEDIFAPGNRLHVCAQQVQGASARRHLIPVCHCCKAPPGFRGLFWCFSRCGRQKKISLFLFDGTHTSSVLLLLPKFTLLAKCQPATIFGHKLTRSNLLWKNLVLISGNQSQDNRYLELPLHAFCADMAEFFRISG